MPEYLEDDADRGELREILLDSVPGLDDGQRDAMFHQTFEAPVEDDHAADDLIPLDAVFDTDDTDDWGAGFDAVEGDPGVGIADDAVEDVTEPGHDFGDDSLLDTHETPDDLSDTHEFGIDHGAGPDQQAAGDLPDLGPGDGDWT